MWALTAFVLSTVLGRSFAPLAFQKPPKVRNGRKCTMAGLLAMGSVDCGLAAYLTLQTAPIVRTIKSNHQDKRLL